MRRRCIDHGDSFQPVGRAIDDGEEVSVAFGRRQRSDDINMDVGESALRPGEMCRCRFSVAVDFWKSGRRDRNRSKPLHHS